jgi:hypothetical protein
MTRPLIIKRFRSFKFPREKNERVAGQAGTTATFSSDCRRMTRSILDDLRSRRVNILKIRGEISLKEKLMHDAIPRSIPDIAFT